MNGITFIEQDYKIGFMRRNDTRACLLKVLKRLGCTSAGITYIFCSDEYLLEINRNYLNHDTFTDVITFDYTLPGQEFPGEEIFRWFSTDLFRASAKSMQALPLLSAVEKRSFLPLGSKAQMERGKNIKSNKGKKSTPNILSEKQACLGSVGAHKGTTATQKEIIENPDEGIMTEISGNLKGADLDRAMKEFGRSMSAGSQSRNIRPVSGDIYISIDRIKENAKMFHVKHIDELNRVMVHGLLHLAGYEDKTPAEEKKIHEKEDEMLAACFPGYKHLG